MERLSISVRGIVQGVGFRPFVFGLASRLGLTGFVRNLSGSVLIEVEGRQEKLECFFHELQVHAPKLSRIDDIQRHPLPTVGETRFRIEASDPTPHDQVVISPDVATCDACCAELFDPRDRRFRYPFLNCTNCGPRLTIIEGAPYDRQRTTMAPFAMCAACLAEYNDPRDRRFHAQPDACPECGPQLRLLNPAGETLESADPLRAFVDEVLRGGIGAIKGLGGFHLVCDARDQQAVDALCARKHRDQKPFAVMLPDVAHTERYCLVSPAEQTLLNSHQRPIVLLRMLGDPTGQALASGVAPGNPYLGVMLPYTPLHHLLTHEVGGAPLVMTSGNQSDEPIARTDREAVLRLGGIAAIILTHNRPIHVRCDDSVTRVVANQELPLRRSRGYAPQPIRLPIECRRPVLAVGGQFKSTFALGSGRHAVLSHHIGDLDHFAAYRAFEIEIGLYEQLLAMQPQSIVHDMHPDYASTGYAARRAAEQRVPLLPVQHHHAHLASCMAEHGLDEQVIGVIFDGTGYGPDQAVWGGEFLVGDYAHYRRACHLRYTPLPGGAKAIQEPWRMAVAHLLDAGCDPSIVTRNSVADPVTRGQVAMVEKLVSSGFNSPPTSSVGRLFDAVAAISGMAARVSYEGQAAMQWEWLATGTPEDGSYPFELADVVDTRPLVKAIVQDLVRGTQQRVIARRFHSTLASIIVEACRRLRTQAALDAVVLSGGVFQNALLLEETCARLEQDAFRVYRHRLVPPNDGGLSLGQLAIAAKHYAAPETH
ncbi:MAG: carbamoyltransferase HypF [Planctomycetales bacterium]|nr:carbamoyltransferase HypF [Planctomycetales bacterium]